MTYGYCRDAALKLLNQYSIAGTVIASSYNNQYDYLKRVPELVNDALELISLAVGQPEGVFVPAAEALEDLGGGWAAFGLPEDFVRLNPRGLPRSGAGGLEYVKDYRLLAGRRLALPRALLPGAAVAYLRAPAKVSLDTPDAEVLDLPGWAAGPAPYYVAAHLAAGEDSFLYAALLNEFEARLEALKPAPESETELAEDAYGLDAAYAAY